MNLTMKIGVCDDDELGVRAINRSIESLFIRNGNKLNITVTTFTKGDNLLLHIDKYGKFDLLILDILMPGLTGIELARELRERSDDCKIIFITGSPEFALDSYKVNAFFYLLKPFSTSELNTLIEKALNEIVEDKSNSLLIKEKGHLTKVKISDIKYIESNNHTIYFHLKNCRTISCFSPMNAYKALLPSHDGFIQCHKSFLVNLNYVVSLSNSDFILEGDVRIPIGRNSLQSAKHFYLAFFYGKSDQ